MNGISKHVFKGFGVSFLKYLFTVLKIINIKSLKKGRISGFLLAYELGPPLPTLLALIGEKNERGGTIV